MYSVITHLRVKSGMEERVLGLFAAENNSIPGLVRIDIVRLDRDPSVLVIPCLFESKESYLSYAGRSEELVTPEFLELLESEPEIYAGEVIESSEIGRERSIGAAF